MLKIAFALLLVAACSTSKKTAPTPAPTVSAPATQKEFSRGEVILGTQLLTKIFDGEMGPLDCVPDNDEASLLLRTIRPRMEQVEDDMEAQLDQASEVQKLVATCDQSCTCLYVDDLLREHLVVLTKAQRKTLNEKRSEKEVNRCMSFAQNTFCTSELYKALNAEKADFSFEEGAL
ncbi:MAG: hypothetical protein ACJ76H_07615 [Bacteriovoracaceae bacterium]